MIEDLKKIFKTFTRSFEILYLINNIKPAIRLDANEEELPYIIDFCNKNNLALKKSGFKIIKQTDSNKGLFSNKGFMVDINSKQKGVIHLYISKSDELAEKAKFFESSQNDKEFGKILGYPDCCIDFFVKNKPIQVKKQNDYILPAFENSEGFTFPFYNNYALRYFDLTLLSHFPCSFGCKKSEELAKRNLKLINKLSKKYADVLIKNLKTAALYTEYNGVFILKNHKLENNNLIFEDVIATSNNLIYQLLKNHKELKSPNKNKVLIGNKEIKNSALMIFT